ncbi:MAG TPA: serine hydrolase domain-containing protein [Pirellulales bacterium]|nr:serine hydrolase domain-containing protein [Pirellulales bacterium]
MERQNSRRADGYARVLALLAVPGVAAAEIDARGRAAAQTPQADAKLVAAIDKLVANHGIHAEEPGVAIMVHQPGRVLFQKGYGLANVKTSQPITRHTLFELASVSKSFTATAVLILLDRGKLSLDDDIRKHLPELPVYAHSVHVRNLLQHTSGLPDYMAFEDVPASHGSYTVNADYLKVFARDQRRFPLQFPPGKKHSYNNTNFMLLASIVERVAKRPYARFLRDEVFTPAGMPHSFLYDGPQAAPQAPREYNRAVGYQWRPRKKTWEADWGVPPDRRPTMLTVGDGSIWTNLEDMLKWDLAVRDEKLLKPATWKLALTPLKTRDGKRDHYGLGWSLYFDQPDKVFGYGHDGSWGGFETSYYRYLVADRTTVLLSNRGTFDVNKLWTALDKLIERHLAE